MQPIPLDRDGLETYIEKQKSAIASFTKKAAAAKKDKLAKKFQHTIDLKTKNLKVAETRLAAIPTQRSTRSRSEG